MEGRLSSGSALFVGTSLSDPNLLRYLHSQKKPSPRKHVAIFTIPLSDPVAGNTAYADAALRKWREVGVDPIQNDMYGQTAQYLHEVRLARELGVAYMPYSDRLAAWDQAMLGWLHDPTAFEANQDLIQTQLTEAVETVKRLVVESGARFQPAEKLGMQLWSRQVAGRELALVGASAFRWSNPDFMPRVGVWSANPTPPVRAFSSGSRMQFELSGSHRPWRSMLAYPIALEDHPRFRRLPVGVLTLTSTAPMSESVVQKLRVEVPDADEYLGGDGGPGQGLLDPEGALSTP